MAVAPNALPRPADLTVPGWAWGALIAAVAVLWMVTFEGGAVSSAVSDSGAFLHEFFHDGRHLLGVPCH